MKPVCFADWGPTLEACWAWPYCIEHSLIRWNVSDHVVEPQKRLCGHELTAKVLWMHSSHRPREVMAKRERRGERRGRFLLAVADE